MKAVFSVLLCLSVAVNSAWAQGLPPTLKPQIGLTIFADGKPVTQQTGLKIDTKDIRVKALLNTKSDSFFADFRPDVLVKSTEVILARNSRRLAQATITDSRLLTSSIRQAQPTDRVVLTFTLVAQRKNGELVPLPEQPTYSFPIHK